MSAPTDHPPTNDQLVDRYLRSAARAFAPLPPEHAAELLADLRDHIAEERAGLDPETEADVRGILDRLGDPQLISAEARRGAGPVSAVPASTPPAPPPPPAVTAPAGPRPLIWLWVTVAAVVAVCGLGAALFLGFYTGGTSPEPSMPEVVPTPTAASPTATATPS